MDLSGRALSGAPFFWEGDAMGRGSACAAVATAGGLWGTIALYSRPLAEMGFTELEIVFLRCAVSALAFGAFLSRRGLVGFKVKLGDAWLFVALGCGSFVTFNLFYLMTIRLSELAIASTLLYLAPSFVIMLSAVFGREFPRRRSVVACALAIAGASLVSGFGATAPSPLVVLCGVASAVCYALYPLIGRRIVGRYAVSTTQFYSFLFAGVCLAPFVRAKRGLAGAVRRCARHSSRLGDRARGDVRPVCHLQQGIA